MLLVYGGSFNPPTLAHYEIAKLLKNKFDCELLFVPVGNSYNKPTLIEFKHRYNMIKIVADKLNCDVSNIEDNNKYIGTYELLKSINNNDVYFIMGADNLVNINSWINASKLIAEFKFIVLNRDNFDCDSFISKLSHPNNFTVVDIDIDISASNFREKKDNSILDKDVLEYIEKFNLY